MIQQKKSNKHLMQWVLWNGLKANSLKSKRRSSRSSHQHNSNHNSTALPLRRHRTHARIHERITLHDKIHLGDSIYCRITQHLLKTLHFLFLVAAVKHLFPAMTTKKSASHHISVHEILSYLFPLCSLWKLTIIKKKTSPFQQTRNNQTRNI